MFEVVITLLAVAVLSWEIAYSDLADYFKSILWLDKEYPKLTAFTSFKLVSKIFGLWTILLFPVMILAMAHRFVYKMIQCPYCLSIWIGLLACYLYNLPYPTSLAIPFFTGLYNLIRTSGK